MIENRVDVLKTTSTKKRTGPLRSAPFVLEWERDFNLSGVTAGKIIDAMMDGQEDVSELVKLRHGKMHSSPQKLAASLQGRLTDHHRFMLRTYKESIESKKAIIAKLDEQIDRQLAESELVLDAELLATIPGVGKEAAAYILAEIGDNMEQFPDEQHLASWAGMSPGSNESAGKKKAHE